MGLFDERKNFRPFQYPVAIELMEQLQHTYWLHSELKFNADPQEISKLKSYEQEAIKRSLLAISTIEVAVKTFWTQLGNYFPIPEWSMLGIGAGESENRHAMAYSELIKLLDLEGEYSKVIEIDCIKGRFDYLNKYLKLSPNADKKKYVVKLILFSVLIENTSLFSQFASIVYFYKYKGIMKDIRNIIKWTAIDEKLHFNIGSTIVNILRKEYPELFDDELNDIIAKACIKSIKYESNILDWVFENGELEKLSKANLLDFMKYQVNSSLIDMGFNKVFGEDLNLESIEFFNEEVFGDSQDDFFATRPVDYTLGDISITGKDLFD